MVFTFLAARGIGVGASLVEHEAIPTARALEATAKARGVQLLLPSDVVVADSFRADAAARVVPVTAIPDGWMVRQVACAYKHSVGFGSYNRVLAHAVVLACVHASALIGRR
jgi:3-phosphoglycerate kinase